MSRTQWLRAGEALRLLGVQPQTLYANVSRQRIRAKADPADPRRSLYHAEDVRRLALRRRGRRRDERIAQDAVAWGDPVLPSAVSTVEHGRLWYRGEDTVLLAERSSLEEVAALLWQCPPLEPFRESAVVPPSTGFPQTAQQAAYTVMAQLAGRDRPMYGRSIGSLHAEAQTLFDALSTAVLRSVAASRTDDHARNRRSSNRAAATRSARKLPLREPRALHESLAGAWSRPAAADLIRRALVLLADHELNASTFATRVAASTGAALSASVLAGFATLSGPLHGGASAALNALIESAERVGAEQAILASLAAGQGVAGFGHRLYPQGDIRASALLQRIELAPMLERLSRAAGELLGEVPNVDFALVALSHSTGLPPDAPFVLFALARTVGWIAHALEQSHTGTLIRPRARYVGSALQGGALSEHAHGPGPDR
ncbi:MAG: citrate synthase [Steroidobacteraceae bacterium]